MTRGIRGWRLPTIGGALCIAGLAAGCGGGGGGVSPLTSAGQIDGPTAGSPGAVSASTASLPRGCTISTYAPNFAADTDPVTGQMNLLYHWTHFPTRVCFPPGDLGTPALRAQAINGFNWWVQETGQMITLVVVSDPTQADVTVQFQNRGATNYGAITDYHTQDGVLHDATITFNMTYLSSVSDLSPVAAHEFGHALGIAGHSDANGDVMSFNSSVYQRTALTIRDINTLQTSYCGVNVTRSVQPLKAGRTMCRF